MPEEGVECAEGGGIAWRKRSVLGRSILRCRSVSVGTAYEVEGTLRRLRQVQECWFAQA